MDDVACSFSKSRSVDDVVVRLEDQIIPREDQFRHVRPIVKKEWPLLRMAPMMVKVKFNILFSYNPFKIEVSNRSCQFCCQ